MYCIETQNLTYKYSEKEIILNNISLQIPNGSIYGFLGPNGAGKTTTLKLILGLLKNQQGTITVFNKNFAANRIEILKNLGSLIESPSLYAHLTALENLSILQKVYQCPKTRINEVLEIVGLSDTKNKRTGQFSLGMKQRLSIAIALLHKPKLLILDEPTNGLDPNGIIEIRELLKKLNTEDNMTIVISSHLLAELEKMVTHVGVINKGSLVFQGTFDELHLKQTLTSVISFETNSPNKVIDLVLANGITPTEIHNAITIPIVDNQTISKLNKLFVQNNIEVYRITTVNNDLETIFMNLINN